VKIKTQAREYQLKEAPEKLCLHHGENKGRRCYVKWERNLF
jgi:hypothetical protein